MSFFHFHVQRLALVLFPLMFQPKSSIFLNSAVVTTVCHFSMSKVSGLHTKRSHMILQCVLSMSFNYCPMIPVAHSCVFLVIFHMMLCRSLTTGCTTVFLFDIPLCVTCELHLAFMQSLSVLCNLHSWFPLISQFYLIHSCVQSLESSSVFNFRLT